jgi:photosynthetic reaction center cytochrome c subunit
MGIGCTHCHNSRYFPSWEVPAKYYAQHMLEMSQYIDNEYSDDMGGQEPSCTLCHHNNILPPGAAQSIFDVPAVLSSYPDIVADVEE